MSAFTADVLASPKLEVAPSLETPGGPPVARDSVLLIEDSDNIAGLIAAILGRRGTRVLRARDAAEGERLFLANTAAIGLVIMDCRLPDMHGGALCQRLRAHRPGFPVLLMSGCNHAPLAQALEGSGPTAFLPKPFLPADVSRRADALLQTAIA